MGRESGPEPAAFYVAYLVAASTYVSARNSAWYVGEHFSLLEDWIAQSFLVPFLHALAF